MDLVVHYLRAAGGPAHVATAATLGEALRCLDRARVDLIIADLHLPDSGGLATVEALRRAGDQLIIVLTGDDDPALRAAAIERGAYDFLHKSQLSEAALGRLVRLATLQERTRRSLRASEARLNAIIEAEPECVKLLDGEGNLLEMNPAGLRMIEAEGLEPVRGHCVLGLVEARDREAFGDLVRRVVAGAPGRLQFEIVGLKGTRRWLEMHAVPFRDLIENRSDAAIVRTIIEMAHTLGFTVVAEGIETEAQAEYLHRHKCEEGQGFLFAKPMPAEALAAMLSDRATAPARKPAGARGRR